MPFTRPVKTIAIGGTHSVLLTDQMQLFMMGDNSAGQLGLCSEKIKMAAYPTLVTSLAHL
jgi:alpha-tubulin suppressor-like RCC1 family protein